MCESLATSTGTRLMKKLKLSASEMVNAARARIREIETSELIKMVGDPDVVIVDIRDIRERQRSGAIPGSVHAPRGMIEFWIDPESPYHKSVFAEDKEFIFFCAGGLRSALAAKTAQDMGLKPVAHMIGGFGAWKKSGAEIVPPKT